MFDIHRKEIDWGGRKLVLETGKIARQATGAVMATYGETMVLCTVVGSKSAKEGQDFFPLTVNYQEKAFAAGKIPGGFFKREARPSDAETLTCRLIDRPVRPLFAEGFKNDTQIICTVLQHDLENDPDIVALVGASAALTISGLPFMGPLGACRVGFANGEYLLNPTLEQMSDSKLDLVVAGTQDAVMMVESEADELSEEEMLGAVTFGHKAFQTVIDGIIDLAETAAKEPWAEPAPLYTEALAAQVADIARADLAAAYGIKDKKARQDAVSAAKAKVMEALGDHEEGGMAVASAFKSLEKNTVRRSILDTGLRIDGRDTKTVRPIECEIGVLPRAHGSALFTRGETQALVVTTLGTGQDEQIIDALVGESRQHFMLHYNFPPYSVGETSFRMGPGRREIGHGKLAWRALHPLMPAKDEFPYTIRIVSEVTESNGSSSMATVCGSSLAMMDAGVPLRRPVAGIAMGLILEGDEFAVLSDIIGDEDHLGDMDFKVAGTEAGVTSLQMDIKIAGITEEIMKIALAQAHEGRNHILGRMATAITSEREELRDTAPRITLIKVPTDKIRDVIGTGGKVIREITEQTGCKIDIDDDGSIKVASSDGAAAEKAINWIKSITAEPEVGAIYKGKVVKTMDFGAFINFFGPRDGLVHISELQDGRTEKVTDVANEGDEVWVKLLDVDDRGKVRLSMRYVNQETGEEIEGVEPLPQRERSGGGGRGGDRPRRRRD
ncbi:MULTISPECIES: polyribonucleotide nucleotidyltransferase [unclassified Minwuia]|uniref:polyribonucleotide nucleotidyltransferase n=1 Tax=unclassified Minwuia TaxID=2618799 RepID=UPI00247891F0|nr:MULTISPECIES: polyribonucleotide nucleotidyltransferase [unclassified Minwuia]